jgi:nitroimidazol reductase NimA-like FMN-containing flavoprotein (pyridoxamine 5'-phosphate oxidase superfamily)
VTNRGLEVLTREECQRLLDARSFGRVITQMGEAISAFPVYYAMHDGDIVFLTYPGTKLGAAVLRSRVTFEIDDETEGWSVMAFGHAEEVRDEDARSSALARLQEKWPEGERDHVVKVHPDVLTGRRLQPPT